MGLLSLIEKMNKKLTAFLESAPEQTTKSAPKPAAQTEPFVYVTTNGKKFHYTRACPGIRNSKEVRMPISKARKAGYTACDKCEKYRYFDGYEII